MLTSLPLWSVMITRGINGLIYYAINTKIPVYMEMVLGYQLQGNGLINSLFYVAICSTQLISGPMARWVIGKKWFSRTVTRKIFESIGKLILIASKTIEKLLIVTIYFLVFSSFWYCSLFGYHTKSWKST